MRGGQFLRCGCEPGLQVLLGRADEPPGLDGAAGDDDFLVQAGAFGAGDHDPDVSRDGWGAEHVAGNDPGGDPAEPTLLADCRGTRPQLGAEQPQAHLDQPVTQVEQDHIGPVSRGIMIEGDRALVTRDRVVEAVVAGVTPGTGQLGQPEALAVEPGRWRCLSQVLVVSEPKRGAHDALHGRRRQVELTPALSQRAGELFEVPRQLAVDLQLSVAGAAGDLHVGALPVGPLAEHLLLDLGRDHLARAAKVLADLIDLLRCDVEEVQLILQGTRAGIRVVEQRSRMLCSPGPCRLPWRARAFPARRDEMENIHLGRVLAMPVDPAVALLQPVGVPRDLPVQQPVAVGLQVDPLAGGVGREQDPHRIHVR